MLNLCLHNLKVHSKPLTEVELDATLSVCWSVSRLLPTLGSVELTFCALCELSGFTCTTEVLALFSATLAVPGF